MCYRLVVSPQINDTVHNYLPMISTGPEPRTINTTRACNRIHTNQAGYMSPFSKKKAFDQLTLNNRVSWGPFVKKKITRGRTAQYSTVL